MHKNLEKLAESIRSHLVMIYEPQAQANASGIILEIAKRYFILTAQHVLSPSMKINLGYKFQQSNLTFVNKWEDSKLDLALLEINKFEFDIFRHDKLRPFRIDGMMTKTIPLVNFKVALCGFPNILKEQVEDSIYQITPLYAGCGVLAPQKWPIEISKLHSSDDKIALLFGRKHGGVFFDKENQEMPFINPGGLSGAGVWIYNSNLEESIRYSLLGVQTSYMPVNKLLIASKIESFFKQIASSIPIPNLDK